MRTKVKCWWAAWLLIGQWLLPVLAQAEPALAAVGAIRGEPAWVTAARAPEPPLIVRQSPAALLVAPAVPGRPPPSGTETERPLRVGEPLDLLQASIKRLVPEWHAGEAGQRIARVAVRSPGAEALRVAVQVRPQSAVILRVHGNRPQTIARLGSDALPRDTRDVLWTPVTEGETQEIEIVFLADSPVRPQILLRQVSVFNQSPSRPLLRAAGGAGTVQKMAGKVESCHEEVACLANAPGYFLDAARSVVRLTLTHSGLSYYCTGTLINDTNVANQVPYVLTAAHCVDSAAIAATANAYFFYQTATCGGSLNSGAVQLSSGAHLLYLNTTTDVALLRLNEPAPAGAFFSGWDPAPVSEGTPVSMIHHPDGLPKAYSVGTAVPPALEGDTSGNHMLVTWRLGSSTGGSSGAPLRSLQDDQFMVRGLLHGGRALCEFSGQTESPLNRDYFARLDIDAPSLRAILQRAAAPLLDYSDVWIPDDELGWGVTFYQGDDDRVLAAFYTQDDAGMPVWYLSLGGRWTSAVRFEGEMALVRNSPALGPYDPARLSTTPAGSLVFNFVSDDQAELTFRIGQGARTKLMKRFRF